MAVNDWVTRDFKALEEGRVSLTPGTVNVITGQNSSGKSSLIQSILAVTQSCGQNGPIILNGPLVRLGTFRDTVRSGKSAFSFGVGIEGRSNEDYWAELTIGPAAKRDSNFKGDPVLTELKVTSSSTTVPEDSIQETDFPESGLTLQSARSNRFGKVDEDVIRRLSTYRQSSILRLAECFEDLGKVPPRHYVEFVGIQAKAIHVCGSESALQKLFRDFFKDWLQALTQELNTSDRWAFRWPSIFIRHAAEESEDLKDKYHRYLELTEDAGGRLTRPLTRAINDLAGALSMLQVSQAREGCISVFLPEGRFDGYTFDIANGPNLASEYVNRVFPQSLAAISEINKRAHYLSRMISYLGPLRDEPRILWSHTSQQSPNLPVGAKGEYSAYVLNRSGHEEITFSDASGTEQHDTLSNAVGYWLGQIGVATGVSVSPEANLGLRLGVEVGEAERDLTAVGVGVSQVLPVVVGLLRTPVGGCFITEQPELHLHPATQAELADFLVSARPDVCVLVETHSEAIVTRVRRRTAEDRTRFANVNLIFVETDNLSEGAKTRSIEIRENGDIADWPHGFLDDGADLRKIMRIRAENMRHKLGH